MKPEEMARLFTKFAKLSSKEGNPGGTGLEGGVVHHGVEQGAEIEGLRLAGRLARRQPLQQQQLADELVHPAGLAFQTGERPGGRRPGTPPRQLERHPQPGERRAQLVRDVPQQSALRAEQ